MAGSSFTTNIPTTSHKNKPVEIVEIVNKVHITALSLGRDKVQNVRQDTTNFCRPGFRRSPQVSLSKPTPTTSSTKHFSTTTHITASALIQDKVQNIRNVNCIFKFILQQCVVERRPALY